MGFLALKAARWEDARRSFDSALERDADNPRLHFGRALALEPELLLLDEVFAGLTTG